MLDRYNLYMG